MTETAVDRLLQETGMEGDPVLASFLAEIELLASVEPPTPSSDVAALMGRTTAGPPRKRMVRRKAVIVVGAVVVSLGMGVSAAAAVSPQIRDVTQGAVEFLIHTIVPGAASPVGHPIVPTPGKTHPFPGRSTPTPSSRTHPSNAGGAEISHHGEPSAIPGRGESAHPTPNPHATPNPSATQHPNESRAPHHGSNP
jgi:hypothetical protein